MSVVNKKIDKWIRPWEIEKFDNLKIRDERFFSIVIKGCLGWLTQHIKMYNKPIKHFIFNTGSSYMYVQENGYEFSWNETSGEDWMYMETPRCLANLTEMSIPQEELTNPFVRGNYERYSDEGVIKGYNAEIRRLPIEITINLQYVLSNFNEQIILVQELFDALVFQRYFKVTYLGQIVQCSIEFPNSQSINQQKIDLASTDDNHRSLEIQIKIATYYPIVNVETEIPSSKIIASFEQKILVEDKEIISDKNTKIIE